MLQNGSSGFSKQVFTVRKQNKDAVIYLRTAWFAVYKTIFRYLRVRYCQKRGKVSKAVSRSLYADLINRRIAISPADQNFAAGLQGGRKTGQGILCFCIGQDKEGN